MKTVITLCATLLFMAAATPLAAQSDEDVQEVIQKFEEGDPGMQAWFREAYTAEPIAADRQRIGIFVLLFIVLFTVFAWLLNREYWKDVH